PAPVIVHGVHAEPEDLDVALVELRLQACHLAELRRAHRGEVLRMREQDAPGVAEILVEPDRPLRAVCCEIGSNVAESNTHCAFLSWQNDEASSADIDVGRAPFPPNVGAQIAPALAEAEEA